MIGKKKKQPALQLSETAKHLLPTKLEFDLDNIAQPNFFRREYIVRNLPESITEGNKLLFMRLLQIPNTTVTMRISDMPYGRVKDLVDRRINDTNTGLFKRRTTDKIEAESSIEDLGDFYRDLQHSAATGSSIKQVNIYIELYGRTQQELEENSKRLLIRCQSLGVSIESSFMRQKEGFVGVAPIGRDTRGTLLSNNIPSNTFGQLYMFSESSLNDAQGMILGRTVDGGIMSLDIWKRTQARTNSNIIITGDSGQGKSHLIKQILTQQYIRGSYLFCFDAENEYSDLARNLGGIDMNCVTGDFTINPLEVRSFRGREDEEDAQGLEAFSGDTPFFQHLSWLADFYKVLIPSLGNIRDPRAMQQLNTLKLLTKDLYQRFGIDEQTDFSALPPAKYPIFSDLFAFISDIVAHPEEYPFYRYLDMEIVKELLVLLSDVCSGSLSPIFNRHTNISGSRLINFKIQELMTGSEDNTQAVLFNYLTYVWNRVLTRSMPESMILVDELHLFLNPDNPIMAKYLSNIARRARKYNCCLLTATQKIMDCLDDRISYFTAAIFDITTYKFLFFPGLVDVSRVQSKLGLTDGEISCIRVPRRGNCLLKVADDRYNLVIPLFGYETALFGQGGGR